ncbi:MAG: 16S rRNA processing protein RimM [Actinobacteria bacterium]|nr:16S rRNA processing protein RimM [Actinomycetota bacterium]
MSEQPDGLLEVGRIGKPHGVRGDLFLSLTSDLVQRREVGAQLIIFDSSGQRTLTITSSRPQQDRWVVHFEGIDDRNAAEKLTNKFLYAAPIDGAEGLWVHQLIGSEVEDTSGVSWGVCTGVLNNPAHDLLELESGVLIPMPFVLSCDEGITVIDPPAGLREALLSDDSDVAE